MKIMRWLGSNVTSIILSLLLALVIWTSAFISENPNGEADFTIPLVVVQRPNNIAVVDVLPETISISILAPESIIQQLGEENPLEAVIDLENISAGTYFFQIQVIIPDELNPIRILYQNPEQIELEVSNMITRTLPISVLVEGEPAIGYQTSGLSWDGTTVTVTGEERIVQEVISVVGTLDISDVTGSLAKDVSLQPRNANGDIVTGIILDPAEVLVNQTITLEGGYRNLAVNVTTTGSVEPGYRFTSITPAPPTVMVFSADPQLLELLPGYVNTKPLDLTGVDDYLETILELDLPNGVTVIGDPTVLIQVNVTALETNMVIIREIEIIGLVPGQTVVVSPDKVRLSVSGPVPVLDNLTLRDIRVMVDITDLDLGVHIVSPTIEILPPDVIWEDISPETVEIIIE
jgi:YbbR domain-containing protein